MASVFSCMEKPSGRAMGSKPDCLLVNFGRLDAEVDPARVTIGIAKSNGHRRIFLSTGFAARLDYHVTKMLEKSWSTKNSTGDHCFAIPMVTRAGSTSASSLPKLTRRQSGLTHGPALGFSIQENTLAIAVRPCPGAGSGSITLYSKRETLGINPAYEHVNQKIYLVDSGK